MYTENNIDEEVYESIKNEQEYQKLLKYRVRNKDIGKVSLKIPIEKLGINSVSELLDNDIVKYFNARLISILFAERYILYKSGNIKTASIQLLYVNSPDKDEDVELDNKHVAIRYGNPVVFGKETDINSDEWDATLRAGTILAIESGYITTYIGYLIHYTGFGGAPSYSDFLKNLRARGATSNKKFHHRSESSTTPYLKYCIYETFLDIIGERKLKGLHRDVGVKRLQEKLNKEKNGISRCIRKGMLLKSLKKLTKDRKCEIYLVWFDSYFSNNDGITFSNERYPIKINNGKATIIMSIDEVNLMEGKKVVLFNGTHVAPSIFKKEDYERGFEKKVYKPYVLRPQFLKNNEVKLGGVLGFDTETRPTGDSGNSIPYCITVFGELDGKKVKEEFYGPECTDEFIEYIDSISTYFNCSKRHKEEKVLPIMIYGFNNSRFDNLLIHAGLYKKNNDVKQVFTENSIKYIKYNNVMIYDMCLFYNIGGLAGTATSFKLDVKKGVFPYLFVTDDNLYYEGKVPERKYWNHNNDRREYIKKEGNIFNMKEYTIKYCMLDSEIVYKMAKIHIGFCSGEINGRKYNVVKCPTSANLSLKIFQQCYLDVNIREPPKDIIDILRKTYKGGRTEVFKKKFDTDGRSKIYYQDINSSYPAVMRNNIPAAYYGRLPHDNIKATKETIVRTNVYFASTSYRGGDSNYIPNILLREEGELNSYLETDYEWHYGCELLESMEDGCIVRIKEELMFYVHPLFKEFIEYFYEERLKAKKEGNASLVMFYKLLMNSLYGKFGQKDFDTVEVCETSGEMFAIIEREKAILKQIISTDDMIYFTYSKPHNKGNIGNLVGIASYVTSEGRCSLSVGMRAVGHSNVCYCDTDSIHSTKRLPKKMLSETKLGKWKIEYESTNSRFVAPKTYADKHGDITMKAKGIKGKNLKFEDYDTMISGGAIEQKNTHFKRGLNYVKIHDQIREITGVYNKRVWNGNNSIAFLNKLERNLVGFSF